MSKIDATSTASATLGAVESELLPMIWNSIVAARTELLLFVAAMIAYVVLFKQRNPTNLKLHAGKAKAGDANGNQQGEPIDAGTTRKPLDTKESAQLERALEAAYEQADYRSVLRYWNAMKQAENAPAVSLAHVVESMQRVKKESSLILRELKAFFKTFPDRRHMTYINDLLESLARRLDSALMEQILEMLPGLGLKMDERSYEIFLTMCFTTCSFQEVRSLVTQMRAAQIRPTVRSSIVLIKTALKVNNFDEALQYFKELNSVWLAQELHSSPSMAPSHVIAQLAELACKERRLSEFLVELKGLSISEEVVNIMLLECGKQKDSRLASSVERLARERGVRFSDITYGLLIRMALDPVRANALFDELGENGVDVTADLAASVLACCAQTSNVELAEKLYGYMKPQQLSVLSAFIRFYAECGQSEKACDVYERDLLRLHGTSDADQSLHLDVRVERSLMNAALKCGRGELAQSLLSAAPSDIGKHITMIRNFAAEKNLPGAKSVFEALQHNGVDMNSVIYNTVLDACVECRDLNAAEAWMEQTKAAGMADVVSFNTLIKAHLQNGHFDRARRLMEEMMKQGVQPNRVTFNELINAMVGSDGRRKEMWGIVKEMKDADVKPNQVTISILLKNLNHYSTSADISNTLDLISTMDEPMDEILLSSIVEACVRIGKPDLLESKLKELQDSPNAVAINGSHTYGSLIKAYGHAKDIDGVWRCWKEMRSRHIKPTSITLGCMVEAVVSLGDSEGAYDLIHQVQDDAQCRGALNSVIYCSVLKGFTREKKIERVWAVYEEMESNKVDLSIVMFNTLIDACARCGRMERLSKVLDDMRSHHIKPNVITYSTMLKGHCQNGDVQTGFLILEEMKKEAKLKPDEIMYNSLLDGCAQNNLVDEGLRLVREMQAEGVQPSNFTLSILVKLMNRARRLDQAFSVVAEITQKYNFRPNVHVYTNLVHACVSNKQLPRGMSILEQMIGEWVAPDSRTYAILVRASISNGLLEQAAGLLRGALGLPDALPFLRNSTAVCRNLDSAVVNEALASFADRGHSQALGIPLLSKIRQDAPRVYIDAATQRKVMSHCGSSDASGQHSGKGKGKGKGGGRWDRQ